MKFATCALLVAATLASCAAPMQSASTTAATSAGSTAGASSTRAAGASGGVQPEMNSRMCQVFRSYQGRGEDQWVREACTRQLGAQDCSRCLGSGL